MTVFVLAPNEGWIADRQVDEFKRDNPDIVTDDPERADTIWLYAGWCWDRIDPRLLRQKRVVCTEHHIVPDKLNVQDWLRRDAYVTEYHVPNRYTEAQVRELTNKPIHRIPYWAHPESVKRLDKVESRRALGLPEDAYIVGSFQRDGEGRDPMVPKLEKGPDRFCDYVIERWTHKLWHKETPNTGFLVLLGGWRRDYVKHRLTQAGVPFVHLENDPRISEMYSNVDMYATLSRFEGGPMALIECGLADVFVLASEGVGLVDELLDHGCGYPDVSHLLTTNGGYEPFRRMLRNFQRA